MVESFSFEELGRTAAGAEDVVSEELEQNASLETNGFYTVDEEIKGLAVADAALVRFGLIKEDLLSKLRGCQCELKAQNIADLKQTTITDIFKASSK